MFMALKAAASRSGVVLAFNASHAALNSAFAASRSLADPIGRPPGRWAVTFQIQIGKRSSPFTNWKLPPAEILWVTSGEGLLIISTVAAQRRALFILALTLILGVSGYITKAWAAGAFAVGKCGAYGHAFDYPAEATARAAALKQCKGNCTAVTMNRACAALSVDMTNPCGPHGYAVKPEISSSLNAATKKCYEFGGKECVIRAWACDAKG